MSAPEPRPVQSHWEEVWAARRPEEVSWFQADPALSLELVTRVSEPGDSVVDVGAGASRLADGLIDAGYSDVTLVDVAAHALAMATARLGDAATRVTVIVGDVTRLDFARTFDVWHDRAVFHFLVDESDRRRYLRTLRDALADRGHAVIATFGPDGPETCSGLPVRRYDDEAMAATLGDEFEPLDFVTETHRTPAGLAQQFLYGLFRRR